LFYGLAIEGGEGEEVGGVSLHDL
nr:hypothetical protein [Chlamydiota bacterium]